MIACVSCLAIVPLTSFQSVSLGLLGSGSDHRGVHLFINCLTHKDSQKTNWEMSGRAGLAAVSPVKSLRYRCLQSVESAVETLKCLQTADSLTTDRKSSSRRTRRRSSGGRAARPNATGRAIAGNTENRDSALLYVYFLYCCSL